MIKKLVLFILFLVFPLMANATNQRDDHVINNTNHNHNNVTLIQVTNPTTYVETERVIETERIIETQTLETERVIEKYYRDKSRGIAMSHAAAQCHPSWGTKRLQGCIAFGSHDDVIGKAVGLGYWTGDFLFNGTYSRENKDTDAFAIGANFLF